MKLNKKRKLFSFWYGIVVNYSLVRANKEYYARKKIIRKLKKLEKIKRNTGEYQTYIKKDNELGLAVAIITKMQVKTIQKWRYSYEIKNMKKLKKPHNIKKFSINWKRKKVNLSDLLDRVKSSR